MTERPLVVICGPTASGKTGLAIRIAKEYDGEVISADSRAIFRGMDIGTAKPSMAERDGVVHWGFDLVDPGERFTVADFKQYALDKIRDIRSRGKLPILVGGTGLYIDGVIYDYQFPEVGNDVARRDELNAWSLEKLKQYCVEHDIILPKNDHNKRHVVNNIIRYNTPLQRRSTYINNCIVVSITTERDVLRRRIEARAQELFASGVLEEAQQVADAYGWQSEAMTGNIYPIAHKLFTGEISRPEAIRQFVVADWRLAKRQLTWLRRHTELEWRTLDDAYTYIVSALADEH